MMKFLVYMILKLAEQRGSIQTSMLAAQMGCTLDPFFYEVDINPVAASANTQGFFLVQSDAGFAICKTTVFALSIADVAVAELQPFGSGLTTGILPFLVTLVDSGAGRSLMSNPVPIDSIFGTAMKPYTWEAPKILEPNSQFNITVQNLSATARSLRLTFHGYKIFGNIGQFIAKSRAT